MSNAVSMRRALIATSAAAATGLYASGWGRRRDRPLTSTSSWDYDWDRRADRGGDGPIRHIILVRHGQYETSTREQGLTALGREQARLVGQRLASWGVPFKAVHQSNLLRARQTAEIISSCLGASTPLLPPDEALNEGCPIEPVPAIPDYSPPAARITADQRRIEGAFATYFGRKPPPLQDTATPGKAPQPPAPALAHANARGEWEVVVCHSNVIRFFFMRVLQLPPDAWNRLLTIHTGITHVVIHPDGRCSCFGFGDCGHLAPAQMTYA